MTGIPWARAIHEARSPGLDADTRSATSRGTATRPPWHGRGCFPSPAVVADAWVLAGSDNLAGQAGVFLAQSARHHAAAVSGTPPDGPQASGLATVIAARLRTRITAGMPVRHSQPPPSPARPSPYSSTHTPQENRRPPALIAPGNTQAAAVPRQSLRAAGPAGPPAPADSTPWRRKRAVIRTASLPGRCPLYVRNHCHASTRGDTP
jgi:hypothetical protein